MKNQIPFPPECSIVGLDVPLTLFLSRTHPTKRSHSSANLVDPCLLPFGANVQVLNKEEGKGEHDEHEYVMTLPSQKNRRQRMRG